MSENVPAFLYSPKVPRASQKQACQSSRCNETAYRRAILHFPRNAIIGNKVWCSESASVVGEVGKHLAIDGQDRTLADEADEDIVSIHDGQRPGMGAVESADYNIH